MNQWSQEQQQFNMMSGMGGPGMGMPPGLLPTPTPGGPGPTGMMPPPVPPMSLMNDWSQVNADNPNFIGPKKTDDNPATNDEHKRDSRDSRKDSDRDRGDRNRRARSPYRSRNDRSRSDRRERRPRWSDNNDQDATMANNGANPMQSNMANMGNMMMPGNNMMAYNNMMPQATMDMSNMSGMNMMPNMMSNMMPNTMSNMMPNTMANMLPNMDQNMMMQQQMLSNQPIYITGGVLLPPLPNVQLPSRRERPAGCRTIFVGGLANGIDESIVAEMFQRFGAITTIKMHTNGVCHVRFEQKDTVELSFFLSGYRLKRHDQMDSEAATLFIDYALNREDQASERNRKRSPTPTKYEPYSGSAMAVIMDKIKSDNEFIEAAPSLISWLERGECNKKNANNFYSAIQASNNQIRRLYNEKMALDEEFQNMKAALKEKFSQIITQFEQVGKILTAAKVQRVSDQFTKQQRRNIEMWFKMTEDLENIKEEYNATFEEDDTDDKQGKGIPPKKYEELKMENERLQFELEGYKNEAFLAKDEAERKFEKFKAHYIAQQALQNNQGAANPIFPPLPPPPPVVENIAPRPPAEPVKASDAKLISILTSFLLVHPLGASVDYLVSYVRSIFPNTTQREVLAVLRKYGEVFAQQTTGIGANLENKWAFVTFDVIKKEVM